MYGRDFAKHSTEGAAIRRAWAEVLRERGLSYRDIARLLGVTHGQVGIYLRRPLSRAYFLEVGAYWRARVRAAADG